MSRYIHLNPVRLKKYRETPIEEKSKILRDYAWSSLPGYIGIKGRDGFMHYDMVLGYLGEDDREGRERYRDYVLRGLSEELENPIKEAKANAILGSDSFVVWVKENFLRSRGLAPRDYTHLKAIKKAIPVEKIAEVVAAEYGINAEEIIKSRSKYRAARQMLLEISYRINYRKKNLRKMGQELGEISGEQITQVHKLVQAKLRKNKQLRTRFEGILSKLLT